jgi:hypothetical protein
MGNSNFWTLNLKNTEFPVIVKNDFCTIRKSVKCPFRNEAEGNVFT